MWHISEAEGEGFNVLPDEGRGEGLLSPAARLRLVSVRTETAELASGLPADC